MKTKFIATSAIVAMLAMFGTAHANTTTKPAKADTHECKPPHEHGKKGDRPNGQKPPKHGEKPSGQQGDRPEPPKDTNGKPMPPKDFKKNGKKDGCPPPPKDGQKSAIPTPKSN